MKYIALLRGINVGGRNSLPMKELITILEALGLENIQTYIQSGNVVFTGKKQKDLTTKITTAIEKAKGFAPHVLLLSENELKKAVSNNPFDTSDGKALHFSFLDRAPSNPDIESLAAVQTKNESFLLEGKVFYLHAPDGIGRSKLASKVEKAMGVPVTARNWNTIDQLLTMLEA